MEERAKVAVVVPALNEGRHIEAVLATMPAYVDRIWVVDDGSDDDTASKVRATRDARVALLQHATPQGVGGALKTGYEAAFADGADVVAVMAGDGQMDPEDLWPLLQPVLRGEADYSKGNRLGHRDVVRRMPLPRLLGNHALSRCTRWATGLAIMDSQCGFTALSQRAASVLPMSNLWTGYGYPNDLLGWLSIHDLRVVDVPIRPIYADEVSGIRLRHALLLIPALLLRVVGRRLLHAWRRAAPRVPRFRLLGR